LTRRTEESKLFGEPTKIKLGGVKYDLFPLVIKDSRVWKAKVAKLLVTLPELANTTTDDPKKFGNAINTLMLETPDSIIDLFFEYAPYLPREEIESKATEQEVADAFKIIMEMAFPLVGALSAGMAAGVQKS